MLTMTAFGVGCILAVEWIGHPTRTLDTGGWRRDERGRIDGRHPDPGLVDFEQIRHQGIEIDIRVGEVVECQFLPVPICKSAHRTFHVAQKVSLHLELGVKDLHI